MKIRNKEYNAEYSSPTLEWDADWRCYKDYIPSPYAFQKEDGWEEVKELSEEEKLNRLRQILSEWENKPVVDMMIDEYKNMIQYDND